MKLKGEATHVFKACYRFNLLIGSSSTKIVLEDVRAASYLSTIILLYDSWQGGCAPYGERQQAKTKYCAKLAAGERKASKVLQHPQKHNLF